MATNTTIIRRRTRLTPEKRKALILDMAAKMVVEEGVSAVSMERLGREAGISKALVYNYFSNRNELLAALLRRDFEQLRGENYRAVEAAENFETMVRLTMRNYLHHVRERGSLLSRLLSEPAVVALVERSREQDQQSSTRFLVRQTKHACNLPLEVAIVVVDMCSGLTEAASKFVCDQSMDFQMIEDLCVKMAMAGLASVARDYGIENFSGSEPLKQ